VGDGRGGKKENKLGCLLRCSGWCAVNINNWRKLWELMALLFAQFAMQFGQRSFASYVGIGMFYVMLSIDIFAISVSSGTVLQRCHLWCQRFHRWCTLVLDPLVQVHHRFGFTVVGLIAAFVCIYCINSMAASEFVDSIEVLYFLLGKLVLPSWCGLSRLDFPLLLANSIGNPLHDVLSFVVCLGTS
jgi:hypothetical protein